MAPAKVGIIGAGMAGPVLAVFLKSKGYDPIVYERTDSPSDAGLGLGIQTNGLRTLSKIPGLLECIEPYEINEWEAWSVLKEDPGLLGVSDHPKRLKEECGFGTMAVSRPKMQRRIIEFSQKSGVPIHWGHKLEALSEDTDSVTVTFANGVKETFSFVVGCDGLHSNTRSCIFGEQPATYTGLSQWGGVSPKPERFRGRAVVADVYGDGSGVIIVPVDETTVIWALTVREPESKESWRAIDESAAAEFKKSPYSQWDYGAGEVIRNSAKIIRYGLYDRPELSCWHKGRVVLIGDAAHPTSPHLGQGANQSYEDVGALTDLLVKHNPSAESPSTETLEIIFKALEAERVEKSSAMVRGARAQGENRAKSAAEGLARNKHFGEIISNGQFYQERFGGAK